MTSLVLIRGIQLYVDSKMFPPVPLWTVEPAAGRPSEQFEQHQLTVPNQWEKCLFTEWFSPARRRGREVERKHNQEDAAETEAASPCRPTSASQPLSQSS